jgi:hypothetical protein
MSTVPFEANEHTSDMSGAWACAKLAITGVAVTGFWVFTFFVIIPALFGR